MTTPPRVTPQEIYPRVQAGEALLVCAYADEARCRRLQLEDSLILQEFQDKLPDLPKDKEIVFYCT